MDVSDLVAANHAEFGETVTYSRSGDSVSLAAVRQGSGEGLIFRIRKTVLILGASEVEPTRGDRITDADSVVYDVAEEFGASEGVNLRVNEALDPATDEWVIPVRKVDS